MSDCWCTTADKFGEIPWGAAFEIREVKTHVQDMSYETKKYTYRYMLITCICSYPVKSVSISEQNCSLCASPLVNKNYR